MTAPDKRPPASADPELQAAQAELLRRRQSTTEAAARADLHDKAEAERSVGVMAEHIRTAAKREPIELPTSPATDADPVEAERTPAEPTTAAPEHREDPATLAALLTARTDADLLAPLARLTWSKATDGGECPPHRIPTAAELADWLPDCPPDVTDEADALLRDLFDTTARWATLPTRPPALFALVGAETDPRAFVLGDMVQGRTPQPGDATQRTDAPAPERPLLLADVHALWCSEPVRSRHPLAPIVDSWQELAPSAVALDVRPRAILPAPWRDLDRDHGRLPLDLDRAPLAPEPRTEAGYLPGLEPPASVVPAVPWLTLYDLTGAGPVQTRGRGAPLAQRLFVEVLTAVPRAERVGGWVAEVTLSLRDLFAWCWPRWYDSEAKRMRGGYDRSKHLHPLRRALVEVDNLRLVVDRMARRLIRVDDLPTERTALDETIRFHVRHLPGSDRGALIDRATARRWGLVSAAAWRASIRLAYLWDGVKAANRGRRIYATRPVVSRGADGVILNATGRPLRDRRGARVTDWSDRRAVILGTNGRPAGRDNPPAFERNPAADRLPVLGPDDLIRLAFDDAADISRTARRKRLHDTRRALTAMETAGEIVRELDGYGGERIIEARC